MRVKEIKTGHFRNLLHKQLKFPKSNFLAIVGNNGSGKTSILDLISILSKDIATDIYELEGIFEDNKGDVFVKNKKENHNKEVPIIYFDSNKCLKSLLKWDLDSDYDLDKLFEISKELFSLSDKKLLEIKKEKDFQFIFPDKKLNINQLGDGYRTFLNIIFVLLKVLKDNKGINLPIVLIDELELHIHPSLHRDLVKIIKAYFTDLQIIITTNSPLIVSELPKEEVRFINPKNYNIEECEYPTYGADSNRLLNIMFDTSERPEEIKEMFKEFSYKIAYRDFKNAREILSRLKKLIGELDSEIVSSQVTLDLELLDEKCFGDKHRQKLDK